MFNACCINPAGWSQRILTLQYHTTKKLRMQAIFGILFCFFAFPTLCSNEIHLLKILTLCGQQTGAQNGGPFGGQTKLFG